MQQYIVENFGHVHTIKPTGEFLFTEQILMPTTVESSVSISLSVVQKINIMSKNIRN